MAVPKFFEFFTPVLEALNENGISKVKDICPIIEKKTNLTKEDMEQVLPSGKILTYKNRIDWAISYLKSAGLIERISHGTYSITESGRTALSSGEKIDLKFLERFESFNQFHGKSNINTHGSSGFPVSPEANIADITPQEAIEVAYKKINDELVKAY